jgi:hypothetical protein
MYGGFMGFFIGLLLALIAVGGLTLRAVAELREHVTERFNALADLEAGLHKLTRGYLGHELLERRVLPAVGYKEPKRTRVQKAILKAWMEARPE